MMYVQPQCTIIPNFAPHISNKPLGVHNEPAKMIIEPCLWIVDTLAMKIRHFKGLFYQPGLDSIFGKFCSLGLSVLAVQKAKIL